MKTPQYRQITDEILAQIEAGELAPGSRVLSSREITEHYSVSQITALRVFKELIASGRVVRRNGLGYFVREEGAVQGNGPIFCVFRPPMQINAVENYGSRIFNGIVNACASSRLSLSLSRHILDLKYPAVSLSEELLQSVATEFSGLPAGTGILLDMRFSDEMIAKYFLPVCADKALVVAGRQTGLPVLCTSVPMTACASDMVSLALQSRAEEFILFPLQAVFDSDILCAELKRGLLQSGVAPDRIRVIDDALTSNARDAEIAAELAARIKSRKCKVMLLVSGDHLALSLQKALREQDIELGRDAALLSLGGFEGASAVTPRISTLAVNAERLGELAVQALLSRHSSLKNNYTTEYKVVLNDTWIIS